MEEEVEEEEEEEEEEELFFIHYKNDLKRHAHTPGEEEEERDLINGNPIVVFHRPSFFPSFFW